MKKIILFIFFIFLFLVPTAYAQEAVTRQVKPPENITEGSIYHEVYKSNRLAASTTSKLSLLSLIALIGGLILINYENIKALIPSAKRRIEYVK